MDYLIRTASKNDLNQISELESTCFPIKEAASKESLKRRLEVYPEHFSLLIINDKVISMVNGLVSNEENLLDEMYSDTDFHDENGKWQMIFAVETHPDYVHRGLATYTLDKFIDVARQQKRQGVVLTCKSNLIKFYEKFGFINEGISESQHGNAEWYQMRLVF